MLPGVPREMVENKTINNSNKSPGRHPVGKGTLILTIPDHRRTHTNKPD